MPKKLRLYVLIFASLTFTGCRKDDNTGGRDYKTLGTSAYDLLSSGSFTSLIIEIAYMPGFEPDPASVNNLVNFLNTYIYKPDGIRVVQRQIPASGKNLLTLNELVHLEKQNRTAFTGGRSIAVHILITDANYTDSTLLGLSYWNTSTCLFGKNIFNSSGGAGNVSRSKLLSTLFQHEFGHLLGLVDQGSPMQTNHRDMLNGAHCNNFNCLMYYGVETADNLGMSANSPIPALDANCISDLKANGGR
jgi:hypothetical protein